jgi:hypothetical protein
MQQGDDVVAARNILEVEPMRPQGDVTAAHDIVEVESALL